jgi:hypothetical protein
MFLDFKSSCLQLNGLASRPSQPDLKTHRLTTLGRAFVNSKSLTSPSLSASTAKNVVQIAQSNRPPALQPAYSSWTEPDRNRWSHAPKLQTPAKAGRQGELRCFWSFPSEFWQLIRSLRTPDLAPPVRRNVSVSRKTREKFTHRSPWPKAKCSKTPEIQ